MGGGDRGSGGLGAAGIQHRRRRARHRWPGHPRRDGRSLQSSADRQDAHGRHRRRRSLSDRGLAAGRLYRSLHPHRLQHCSTRGYRAGQRVHRAGEYRAPRRRSRRVHHGDGRGAGRRYSEHPPAADDQLERARRAAERQRRPADARLRHARLCDDACGRGRHARQLVRAGRVHALSRQDGHARLVRRFPQPVLHRRGIGRRLHHRQRHDRRDAARDERHGRRRRLGQHQPERHPEKRRQFLPHDGRRLLLERRDAGQQPERLPALVQHQFGGRSRRHLPDRRPAGRADHARQGLVLRGRWPVGVARQPARRVLQQPARRRQFSVEHALLSGTARNAVRQAPPTTPVGQPPASTGIGRTPCE